MVSTIVTGAVLGLSALAAARPHWNPSASNSATATVSAISTATGTGSAVPSGGVSIPVAQGYNVTIPSKKLNQIQQQALGTLPNGPPPPMPPSADSIASLGLVAFNELFEVSFFRTLIQKIEAGGSGFSDIKNREEVLRVLKVVLAQEELHELNANKAFTAFTSHAIEPCEYKFPVDNYWDAIKLASKFTDVVLSTLPDIQTLFGADGDAGLIRGVGSVIGQEGEQNGFYHEILGQVPSQLPFLTGGARNFAFNAILQNFVVTDSCPSLDLLLADKNGGVGFNVTDTLTIESSEVQFGLEDFTATFSTEDSNAGTHEFLVKPEGQCLTYLNQQNVPISVPMGPSQPGDGRVTFTAEFPGKKNDLNGLTIAAVTNGCSFANPDEVAAATVFGPALIEVNQNI